MSDCSETPPVTKDFYDAISSDVALLVCLAIASVTSVLTIAIFIETLVFICRHHGNQTTTALKFGALMALYPIVSVLSLVSVLVPSSNVLLDLISSCYLSVCIYLFITVIIDAYGGTDKVLEAHKDNKVSITTPPCCCFLRLCCVQPITLTKRSLLMFEMFGLQTAIVRPTLLLTAAILWTDGLYKAELAADQPYLYLTILLLGSTLLSLYGVIVLFRMSIKHLAEFSLVAKFASIQLMVILVNLQSVIFQGLGSRGIPACSGILGSEVRANLFNNIILVFESFLLVLVARRGYKIVPQTQQDEKTNGLEDRTTDLNNKVARSGTVNKVSGDDPENVATEKNVDGKGLENPVYTV